MSAPMDWHEAYLVQSRSEHAIFGMLQAANVEYSHRLHYLQMLTEKLAKAILTPSGSRDPAPTSHVVFVRMLQTIRTSPGLRRKLGYRDKRSFIAYIDSMLGLAGRIERLSPDQAGLTRPNPEYPWQDPVSGAVLAPARYAFPEFDRSDARMTKMVRLIDDLLRVTE